LGFAGGMRELLRRLNVDDKGSSGGAGPPPTPPRKDGSK
jgi:hypothetical protein